MIPAAAYTRPAVRSPEASLLWSRVQVRGKFLYQGDQKLLVRGTTYGTFRQRENGSDYPAPEILNSDFAAMSAAGINAVRTYTPPPRLLLDQAQQHGLRVMVGLPWEQHIAFLDTRASARSIRQRVAANAKELAGHPALLCLAVGNEIPASIVRWYGRKRIETFLRELYDAAKETDPSSLVTYVNFPTTEYLDLSFCDLACFNVYLETPQTLSAYLAKLQTLAGNKPLLMGEMGLDSQRNGERHQAEVLSWQIERTFAAGCAGTFVFSWTDEWHRGGSDIEDWDFGLTTRDRTPKPALAAVARAFADPLCIESRAWPRISVVICTYNGSRTLRETLTRLRRLDYPDYEVIVVNDGSRDNSAEIASEFDVRLIDVENGGLSRARNIGADAANGAIIAYLDDDAFPDEDWLIYVALTFLQNPNHAAVGGPNLPPSGDGRIAQAVANSPGGPLEVMLSDDVAEHIPGCNFAVLRERLLSIGGFDPRFRTAGDDVDVCWRLIDRGWTIGFHPSALVWHHRRNSIRAFWKQQRGYGIAEAVLERKHRDRYNLIGHVNWRGRVYGQGTWQVVTLRKWRVYHGSWNTAPFQSLYQPRQGYWEEFVLAPEWYIVVGVWALLGLLGFDWKPLRWVWPLGLLAAAAPVLHVLHTVAQAPFPEARGAGERLALRILTAFLCATQPLARLWGRLSLGLTPFRKPNIERWKFPVARTARVWSETWRSAEQWLEAVEHGSTDRVSRGQRGGEFDPWDLEFAMGFFGSARLTLAVEEHGAGKQLLRIKVSPRMARRRWAAPVLLIAAAFAAFTDSAYVTSSVFTVLGVGLLWEGLREVGGVVAEVWHAVSNLPGTTSLRSAGRASGE